MDTTINPTLAPTPIEIYECLSGSPIYRQVMLTEDQWAKVLAGLDLFLTNDPHSNFAADVQSVTADIISALNPNHFDIKILNTNSRAFYKYQVSHMALGDILYFGAEIDHGIIRQRVIANRAKTGKNFKIRKIDGIHGVGVAKWEITRIE